MPHNDDERQCVLNYKDHLTGGLYNWFYWNYLLNNWGFG
jgi:hypothetical protein